MKPPQRILRCVCLALVVTLGFAACQQPPPPSQTIHCADPVRGCAFAHRSKMAQLRFSHPPKALQAFTITLQAPDARQVTAEFQMQQMEMGPNRYTFMTDKAGQFVAHVTLPVCVTGRRDWKLHLQIDTQRYAIAFTTL